MREDPVFITGSYRSGTTIISRILDAHPSLNITYDSVNYFRFIVKKGTDASDYHSIVDAIADRLNARYKIVLDRLRIVEEIEGTASPVSHKAVYSAIMHAFWNYSDKRWGEKSLLEWTSIPIFLSMFSKGKAIHIVRDPRDVLVSYKHMTIEPGNRYLDSVFVNRHSFDYALKYAKTLPPDRYYLLKYENFMGDNTAEVKKICDFLEINFVDSMMDERNFTDQKGDPFDYRTHTSFPDEWKRPVKRWKEKLNEFEVDFAEGLLWKQMQELGYELSNNFGRNRIAWIINTVDGEPLLKERMVTFLSTGTGVEFYPSDPTLAKNWGDTGVKGQGAAAAYGKRQD